MLILIDLLVISNNNELIELQKLWIEGVMRIKEQVKTGGWARP